MSKRYYFDHASTTAILPEVLEAMLPYFSDNFGNPSSRHSEGVEARKAVDQARKIIAEILNCKPREIVFTSGGTEANNLAILGVNKATKAQHLITSNIEHSSVHECCEELKKEGTNITQLKIDQEGLLTPQQLEEAITPETKLCSIIYANNEIGTVQNIAELGQICQEHKILFHSDACQAAGACSLDTQDLNLDLMTLNAGKIYGPKGVGLLFVKEGTPIKPIILGGNQEQGLRSGTLNVPAIVGLARALEIAQTNRQTESQRLSQLRDQAIEKLQASIPSLKLNGHPSQRLPNNINITIPRIDADNLILLLDQEGIAISAGSACDSDSTKASRVLTALGLTEDQCNSSIRITLGKTTSEEDIDYLVAKLSNIYQQLSK
jgi:cysteine desulfurase